MTIDTAALTKIVAAIERGEMDGIDSDQIYRALGWKQCGVYGWWPPHVVEDARRKKKSIQSLPVTRLGDLLTSLDAGEMLGVEIRSADGAGSQWKAYALDGLVQLGAFGSTELLARLAARLRVIERRQMRAEREKMEHGA